MLDLRGGVRPVSSVALSCCIFSAIQPVSPCMGRGRELRLVKALVTKLATDVFQNRILGWALDCAHQSLHQITYKAIPHSIPSTAPR